MLEQEIKLVVDDQKTLDSIVQSELIRPYIRKRLGVTPFIARYHDTPNRDFTLSYSSLRSRMEGELMRATFKEKGSIVDGLSQHQELETIIDEWLETPGMLPDGPLKSRVLQIVNANDPLETIVSVEMSRTILELNIESSEIECAADSGYIFANRKSVPLFELELELKQGELLPMRQLAEKLKERYSLAWSTQTKLAIGMKLWNN